jgi:hypothetical protein
VKVVIVVFVTVGLLDEHYKIRTKQEYDNANVEAGQELEAMLVNDLHENSPRLRLPIDVQKSDELEKPHGREGVHVDDNFLVEILKGGEKVQIDDIYENERCLDN